MSGGVVYGPPEQLSRYGEPFQIAANAVIPPGWFYITGSWILVDDTDPTPATISTHGAGFCISDGTHAKAGSSAVNAIAIGPRNETWPWPKPWPLT